MPAHDTRACAACGLRFPAPAGSNLGQRCPACGAATVTDGAPFDTPAAPPPRAPPVHRLRALLDNVRSLSNVGAIFRSADGAGIEHLHLCGITPTPDHPKLDKTALGAQRTVAWTHHPSALDAARDLAGEGWELWALEGDGSPLFDAPLPAGPTCLLLGHEVAGIDPRLRSMCARTLHLPMSGVKTSLNVSAAFTVAAYVLRHDLRAPP